MIPDGDAEAVLVVDAIVLAADGIPWRAGLADLPRELVRSVVVALPPGVHAGEPPAGVTVLSAPGGAGARIRQAIEALARSRQPPDAVLLVDGRGRAQPADLRRMLFPLREGTYDLVVGSRALAQAQGSPLDRLGRAGAVALVRALYGYRYTDVGRALAVRWPALVALDVHDGGEGLIAEIQVRALKVGLRVAEVPLRWRPIAGRDSGCLDRCGHVLYRILRHAVAP